MKDNVTKTFRSDRWLKPFFKQYRASFIIALLLGFITAVCAGALMFVSGYLITHAAEMPWSIMAIHFPTLLARIFGIGKPTFQYLERLTSHNWVLRMTSGLRRKLYESVEKDALFFRHLYRTGDALGLLAEDIGHIQNLYLRTILPTIIGWLLYLFMSIGFGFFSIGMALIMLLLLGVIVILIPLLSVLMNRERETRRKEMKSELYRELTDNVLGVSDWLYSQRTDEYLSRYQNTQEKLQEADAKLHRFARWRDLILQVIFGLIVVAILAWAGLYFGGMYGGSTVWIAAFTLGFFPLIDSFAVLPDAAQETLTHKNSVDNLNKLPDPLDHVKHESPEVQAPLTLAIENVSFEYPGNPRVILDNVSLTLPQGKRIAMLGRSGSGKSTLATLIRGDLKPTSGSVTLGGVNTSRFGDNITHYIGVIQQQTYLFNMTLLDNLRIGDPSASEEKVKEALKKVGLETLLERLPEGLNTLVDEAGMRFSGGERHRIALARILLQDVPIIILDEPMVGLDPLTERDLLDTILQSTEGKTLIMITHHLQGVSEMDGVIFLENGRLEISGCPTELEKTNPRYQKLLAFDKGL